ncbi:MAG: DUF262 domain-containing protein [Gordonia sp. (in: high G+C Gram-positive bacteria)]|uniref:DUF262 domain-containing protein n=1 Tax=Gordonia sp. (in: high G+C Gram-positive bacteria) TaxID=84139 RepID=UPI0039E3296B
MPTNGNLKDEIASARRTIKSDSYSISLGELISQYENNEIEIHPEFQRLFRWTSAQKSRLIETILLGIPLPSIFVMQREDSIWELIDGLQRISTVLEFVGKLKNEKGKQLAPLELASTEYLPSLQGMYYDDEGHNRSFTADQRLAFRRAKIDVTILLPESSVQARGELFDRLNTGGSQATPQEIRFARFVMEDPKFAAWLKSLRALPEFDSTVSLSTRLTDESYDMELIGRFISSVDARVEDLAKIESIEEFLTTRLLLLLYKEKALSSSPTSKVATVGPYSNMPAGLKEKSTITAPVRTAAEYEDLFRRTFTVIRKSIGEDAFRPYDSTKGRFKGSFSVSAFEFVTCGVSWNIDDWENTTQSISGQKQLLDLVQKSWDEERFRTPSGRGSSSRTRLREIVPFAREYFALEAVKN